jgi:hypothetical protein
MAFIDKHWKVFCCVLLLLAAGIFIAHQGVIFRLQGTAQRVPSGLAQIPVLLGKSTVFVTAEEGDLYQLFRGIVPIGIGLFFAGGGLLIRHQKNRRSP